MSFYESRAWLSLRFKILQKYGRVCALCQTTKGSMHVDHIKPRSLYPELELESKNLQVLCRQCNLGKGNKSERDFREKEGCKVCGKVVVGLTKAARQGFCSKGCRRVQLRRMSIRTCECGKQIPRYLGAIPHCSKYGYCSNICYKNALTKLDSLVTTKSSQQTK